MGIALRELQHCNAATLQQREQKMSQKNEKFLVKHS